MPKFADAKWLVPSGWPIRTIKMIKAIHISSGGNAHQEVCDYVHHCPSCQLQTSRPCKPTGLTLDAHTATIDSIFGLLWSSAYIISTTCGRTSKELVSEYRPSNSESERFSGLFHSMRMQGSEARASSTASCSSFSCTLLTGLKNLAVHFFSCTVFRHMAAFQSIVVCKHKACVVQPLQCCVTLHVQHCCNEAVTKVIKTCSTSLINRLDLSLSPLCYCSSMQDLGIDKSSLLVNACPGEG